MTKYGWMFSINQQTLKGAYHFLLVILIIAKKYIPFILARRICMISEQSNERLKHIEILRVNLKQSGYPKTLIESGITRALNIPQEELRLPKIHSNENNLSFITTFNPNNPQQL